MHGTVDVLLLLLLLLLGGTTLVFDFSIFFSRYLNLYEITFVDNNEVTNREIFSPL